MRSAGLRLVLLAFALPRAEGFVARTRLPAATHPLAAVRSRVYLSARDISLIEDTDAYHALIESATQENRVVVIKFYASWCRACKAMSPKYARVAADWPDIEFQEILFDNNKSLCKSLGIKILPYIEIIRGSEGKVEGFTCGPSKISRLQEKLEQNCLPADRGELPYPEFTDVSELLNATDV